MELNFHFMHHNSEGLIQHLVNPCALEGNIFSLMDNKSKLGGLWEFDDELVNQCISLFPPLFDFPDKLIKNLKISLKKPSEEDDYLVLMSDRRYYASRQLMGITCALVDPYYLPLDNELILSERIFDAYWAQLPNLLKGAFDVDAFYEKAGSACSHYLNPRNHTKKMVDVFKRAHSRKISLEQEIKFSPGCSSEWSLMVIQKDGNIVTEFLTVSDDIRLYYYDENPQLLKKDEHGFREYKAQPSFITDNPSNIWDWQTLTGSNISFLNGLCSSLQLDEYSGSELRHVTFFDKTGHQFMFFEEPELNKDLADDEFPYLLCLLVKNWVPYSSKSIDKLFGNERQAIKDLSQYISPAHWSSRKEYIDTVGELLLNRITSH